MAQRRKGKGKNMKRMIALLMTLLMLCSMTACGNQEPSGSSDVGDGKISIICAHVDPEDSVTHQGMLKFKEYMESNTDGRVEVQIYPNGQLGGEQECIQGVSMGSVQLTVVTASVMACWGDKFNLMELPFLFEDYDAVYNAYEGELGEKFGEWMEEYNCLNKGFYCGGFRAMSNSVRPIHTPDDMKGLKMRCIESEMFLKLFQLLGANPTPMSFNEVYTGLEQGTIEGQDNPATLTYTSKFYEPVKYFTSTNHVALCIPIVVQKDFYENLPDDIKTVLDEGCEVLRQYCKDGWMNYEQECIQMMSDYGIECSTLTEEQAQMFKEKVAPIYDDYRAIVGDEMMDLALSY